MDLTIHRLAGCVDGMSTENAQPGLDAFAPYALLFGLLAGDRLEVWFTRSWVQACGSLPGWQSAAPSRVNFDDPDFSRHSEWRGIGPFP